jgi:enterochelin esterase-like enzyme
MVYVYGDTSIKNNILYWLQQKPGKRRRDDVTGTVRYHRQLSGSRLLPRDIVVWLPPGYGKKKTTSAFGIDWRVDESCDSLIRQHQIEPVIVVGISNTPDRSLEYVPGDKGDDYMDFVVTKVKPLIDSEYRTISDRDHTLTGGSSAGGLIAFMLAWEYPEIFSYAICMSPAFKILNIDYVSEVEQSEYTRKNMFFFISNGGVGLDADMQPGISLMISALRTKGYAEGRDYVYLTNPAGEHNEKDWGKLFPFALRRCISGK